MKVTTIVAAAALAAFPLAASPASAPMSAAGVLARVRAATLSRPLSSIRSIHATGALAMAGLEGRSERWVDVVHHSEAQRTTGAWPIAGAQGWTGSVAWNEDATGIVHAEGGAAERIAAIDSIYIDSYAYLLPGEGGATLSYVGERHENGRAYIVIDATPPGGSTLALWIDRSTHLIAKVSTTIGLISATTVFSDYRRIDGIEVAFDEATTQSDGNNQDTKVAHVWVNESGVAAHVQMPPTSAHDFSISGGVSTTVPIDVVNNHIYIHDVMLDGKGPFTFLFDTGGAFILTPETVAALNVRANGSTQVGGVGATTEGAQFARVARVQIGGATMTNQNFGVLPIGGAFASVEGVKIDGMVGSELPDRFVTRIDYAHGTLTLSMPSAALPSGSEIPFAFDETVPLVPIRVDGVAATAEVDTGGRGALDLFSPFLATHPQLAAKATTANGVAGFGVGGATYAKLGRTDVTVGPYTLRGVVTAFTTQTTGAFADPLNQSNLGGDFWKRFTLTLDYRQQRIFLTPSADYRTAFTYDRSGLFLANLDGNVVVVAVRAGTPAETAGLAKGDVIQTIDGKPAASYTLAKIRALLSGAPGAAVRLHVRNGSQERDVTLTLAEYI